MLNFSKLKYFLKSISNIHIQASKNNIFLFATPRGGSTWLMEIIASQPGMKFFDEPFNIRRDNVKNVNIFSDWSDLMPDSSQKEVIFKHIDNLEKNRIRYMNPPPFRKNHRFFTSRIVYKIHEIEHLVGDIQNELNGKILLLIRHPLANTISRHVFPRLTYFLNSDYYKNKYLSNDQIEKINKIISTGTTLQKGVVSWCFENLIILEHAKNKDCVFITYEELVLNSEKSCRLLQNKLDLPDLQSMLSSVGEPAMNIMMSNKDTLDIMHDKDNIIKKRKLVTKWKKKVTESDEKAAFEILDLFNIDIYEVNRYIATEKYLNFTDTSNAFN